MTRDLTQGSPFRQILLFSIPFLIGNLFQQLYNVVDMVIVGRALDSTAYAAVGATGSLVWFASGAIQSLTTGFSVIAAHHFGAGDEERVKKSFGAAIKLSAIISVALAIVCVLLTRPILTLLRTPEDIFERSYRYIIWIFVGLVATALYNLLSGMIRALGDSRTPLYFLIIACIINIILDIVFIVFCGMDTDGAGLATVVAQLISGLLCILYIKQKHPLLHLRGRHFHYDCVMDKSLLKIGIPMAFLNMVLSIGSVVMQFVTNGMGTLYVSSQTTGSKIESFVTQPLLSLGSSVAVFTAQNYGAKRYDRVIDGSKKTVYMSLAWCGIASCLMIPFGSVIVRLLAGDVSDEVTRNAYTYILVNTVMTPILSWLIVYKSVLQSVGRTTLTMISGFSEILARAGLALAVLFMMSAAVFGEALGFFVMCFANPLAWLFGLLTVIPDYILMKRQLLKRGDQPRESSVSKEQ